MASAEGYTVGIVGASGAVGQELLKVLQDNRCSLPILQLRLFGSPKSAGTKIVTTKTFQNTDPNDNTIEIELFHVDKARECQIVFLAVSGSFALENAPAICAEPNGAVVIDNSSAFRYQPEIPLVVPEINGTSSITKSTKLIANPNCTTAIALMAVYPLIQTFGIKKMLVSTYQAASGAGAEGMEELLQGTKAYLLKQEEQGSDDNNTIMVENKVFVHPLPFNVIPHIDTFQENGYTKEEMKVTWETRKICQLDETIPISCSAVRIPTIRAHSEVIVLETEHVVDLQKAKTVLGQARGVDLVDDITQNQYPMPWTATGQYNVQVGRLRQSLAFGDHGLEFFVCGDQLLRGAALNAVLIAEIMHTRQIL